ncbi:MAG: BamA/TamA family outer membrane protein, partial [Candidatus Latescibacterota bacterium]
RKHSPFETLFLVLLLPMSLLLTGGFIEKSPIPGPFAEDITFGEVIKEIRLEGNEIVKDEIVYMAMKSKPGEIYTEESATLDYKWLTQFGTFTTVRFSTIKETDGVILVVELDEVNKLTPAPVIRITDENGLSIGARLTSNSVMGWGSKGSAYFTVGGTTNFGVRFQDPWVPGKSWFAGYKLDYEHAERENEIYEFDENSDDLAFEINRNVTDNFHVGPKVWYLTLKSDQPNRTLSEDGRDHIPGLGLFFHYDRRNLPIYPTQGFWAGIDLKKYGLGGTDTDYWQMDLDVRKYLELAGPRNALALTSLATLSTGEVGVNFPIYMQYNLGGANSVRGWSLGSRDGKNQWINTAEYWRLLVDYQKFKVWFLKFAMGLQLGVFGDAGTAWSESDEFSQSWIAGGGAGLRFLMPAILMFRADVAYGESGHTVRFFLAVREKAVQQRMRVR